MTFSSNALAIASSTKLSRRPMRRSPLMILITYLASTRRSPPKYALKQIKLARRYRCSSQLVESRSHFRNRQGTLRRSAVLQNILRRRAKIAMAAISRRKRNFALARYFSHSTPQQRAANLQCSLFPGRKSAPREKHRRLGSLVHSVVSGSIPPPDAPSPAFWWWRPRRRRFGQKPASLAG